MIQPLRFLAKERYKRPLPVEHREIWSGYIKRWRMHACMR